MTVDVLGFRNTLLMAISSTAPAHSKASSQYEREIREMSNELNFTPAMKSKALALGKARRDLIKENKSIQLLQLHKQNAGARLKLTADLQKQLHTWLTLTDV